MKTEKPKKNPEDRHPFFDQISQLWRNKTAMLGLVIITIFILSAIFAPYLTPHDPIETSLYDQLKPPIWHETGTWKHILGTDDLGRDILSRLIYGARVSLIVAVISVGLAFFCGTLLGCISGYYKGVRDSVIMRLMDIILAFPYILLAIVVLSSIFVTGCGISQEEHETVVMEAESLTTELESVKGELADAESELLEIQNELEVTESKLLEVQNKLEATESELESAFEEINVNESEAQSVERQLSSAQSKVRSLEVQIEKAAH